LQNLFGNGKRLRYLCQDEMRVGLKSETGRVITARMSQASCTRAVGAGKLLGLWHGGALDRVALLPGVRPS